MSMSTSKRNWPQVLCADVSIIHLQSARDVYYRFTLHYKKENLVVGSNLGDFFILYLNDKNIKR